MELAAKIVDKIPHTTATAEVKVSSTFGSILIVITMSEVEGLEFREKYLKIVLDHVDEIIAKTSVEYLELVS